MHVSIVRLLRSNGERSLPLPGQCSMACMRLRLFRHLWSLSVCIKPRRNALAMNIHGIQGLQEEQRLHLCVLQGLLQGLLPAARHILLLTNVHCCYRVPAWVHSPCYMMELW
jgi:hypothetical protein